MGYYYVSSANPPWQGNPMGKIPPYSGDPRATGSSMNYFMLYNKYTNTLRVMGSIENLQAENTIYVKLRFLTSGDYNSADPYQPNVNALFNHYNVDINALFNPYKVAGDLALDQKTTVQEVTAPSIWPTTGEMFYADFHLAYDPCICLFQSGFEATFTSIQTANLELSGTYAGANIPIADVTNYSGLTQQGNNFIASVFSDGATPQSAILDYNNAANIIAHDASQQASLNGLSLGFGLTSDVFDATSTIPWWGPIGTTLKDMFDQASKITSYYSSQLNPSGQVAANAAITLQSGYLHATGTITDDPSKHPGKIFRIGVPGSKDAGTLPEYAGDNSYLDVLPNYPMYNETPGLFALLKTPEVNEFSNIRQGVNFANDIKVATNTNGTTGLNENITIYLGDPAGFLPTSSNFIIFEYQAVGDLVYSLSPLIDPSLSQISIAYEIDGMPYNFPGQTAPYYTYYPDQIIGNSQTISLGPVDYGGGNYFTRIRTETYPIGCNSSIYTKERYSISETLLNQVFELNDEFSFISGVLSGRTNQPRNVNLVVMLALSSYPDVYGKRHASTQIIKYPCKVNLTHTDFESSGAGATAISAIAGQTNRNLGLTTYLAQTNEYSFGTLTITGDQWDSSPTTDAVNIIGQNEIVITAPAGGEVGIYGVKSLSGGIYGPGPGTGNISLYTQPLPPFFNTCSNSSLSPVNGANLTSYCNGTGYNGNKYLANQAVREGSPTASNTKSNPTVLSTKATIIQTKLGTNIKLGIFPNPTTGDLYINLSAQTAGNMLVRISDVNGRVLINNTYHANAGGTNSYTLDLSSLENGVYAIAISDDAGNMLKQDKVILAK